MVAQMDAQRAVSMVRARAAEFSLESSHIGIMGFSAGGHLGITLSSNPVRMYTPLDEIDSFSYKPGFQILIYSGPNGADKSWYNDTLAAAQPPSFFAVAENDPCQFPDMAAMAFARWVGHGVKPAELHVYSDGGHGFARCSEQYMSKWYPACSWTGEALAFIDNLLVNLTGQ